MAVHCLADRMSEDRRNGKKLTLGFSLMVFRHEAEQLHSDYTLLWCFEPSEWGKIWKVQHLHYPVFCQKMLINKCSDWLRNISKKLIQMSSLYNLSCSVVHTSLFKWRVQHLCNPVFHQKYFIKKY